MDGRRSNQLLRLDYNIISMAVALLTGHCVMGRHAERMQFPLNDFRRGSRSAEEKETVIEFICQCPSLARCIYRLFGSPILISLTEVLPIDVKDIDSLIKLSSWISSIE